MSDEHRAGILHPSQIGTCIDGKVFRREAIGQHTSLLDASSNEYKSLRVERLLRDAIGLGLSFYLERNLFRQIGPAGDQD